MSRYPGETVCLIVFIATLSILAIQPVSANDMLTADFSGSPGSGPAPLDVQFNDTTAGSPSGWYWWFGDGAFSYQQNPGHRYLDPGTYNVTLVVTDRDGHAGASRKQIAVKAAPRILQGINLMQRDHFPILQGRDAMSTIRDIAGEYATIRNGKTSLFSLHPVEKEYNVTFTGEGLPGGVNWSVILTDSNGTKMEMTSCSDDISFPGLTGSYAYSIPLVKFGTRRVNISAIPSSGLLDGTRKIIPIQFSHFEPSWAGYLVASNVSDPGHDVTAVRGSWRVPVLAGKPDEMTPVFQWTGIGGFFPGDSGNLIQAGTASLVGGMYGFQFDYGWTEMLPDTSEMIPPAYPVKPGDDMWADIHAGEQGTWNITLGDATANWNYTRIVRYNSSMDSAEWVLENPSYEGESYDIADFGRVDFGTPGEFPVGNTATVGPVTGPYENFSGFSITMVNNNTSLARPSGLAKDGSFDVERYSGN